MEEGDLIEAMQNLEVPESLFTNSEYTAYMGEAQYRIMSDYFRQSMPIYNASPNTIPNVTITSTPSTTTNEADWISLEVGNTAGGLVEQIRQANQAIYDSRLNIESFWKMASAPKSKKSIEELTLNDLLK